MSSFIGHSLAGFTTYAVTQQLLYNHNESRHNWKNYRNWMWLIWLLAIASIPDIDYLIPALRVQHSPQILRITHSIFGTLLLPIFTILGLWLSGDRGRLFKIRSLQVLLVGLSHLLLDTLTGVFPLPLLIPFSTQTFRLPFGLLPSAGRIQLNNYYLYHNLLIEMGVLIPLSVSLLSIVQNSAKSLSRLCLIAAGLTVSVFFMHWASTLSR
jgi:inner membrane protein